MAELTVVGRAGQATLEQIGKSLWGFKPRLMQDIVAQHGPVKSVGWFARNMPTYERILREWGPIRTHLVATVASTLNGCPYCTYGHAYALELHYFAETDRLMSADEREIESWCTLDDRTVELRFRRLLVDAGLAEESLVLDRVLDLRSGAEPGASADDRRVAHLLMMFDFLNRCGMSAETATDEAHDPINKNAELRARYHNRRQAQAPAGD